MSHLVRRYRVILGMEASEFTLLGLSEGLCEVIGSLRLLQSAYGEGVSFPYYESVKRHVDEKMRYVEDSGVYDTESLPDLNASTFAFPFILVEWLLICLNPSNDSVFFHLPVPDQVPPVVVRSQSLHVLIAKPVSVDMCQCDELVAIIDALQNEGQLNAE